jgi:flagellar biosynthesis protein FlhG
LDLYRFIKLAAIRRVLSFFLAREAMAEALSDRDFASVEDVLTAAGQADAAGRDVAETALRTFHPLLVVNRVSGRSRVNVLGLRNLLKAYIGGELSMMGEIPDDPAVERSVRQFLPVVETEPQSPAACALATTADTLLTVMNGSPSHPVPMAAVV